MSKEDKAFIHDVKFSLYVYMVAVGHGTDYGIQKLNCEFMQLESKKIKSGKRVKIVIIK